MEKLLESGEGCTFRISEPSDTMIRCADTPVGSVTCHVMEYGSSVTVEPSTAGVWISTEGRLYTPHVTESDHAPQSGSRPFVLTCTEYVPFAVNAELVQLVAVTPNVVDVPLGYVTFTCADSCAEPSGWLGVQPMVTVEPLAMFPFGLCVIVGARGGVMVTREDERVQSEARSPIFALTLNRTVPALTVMFTGTDVSDVSSVHVVPPS